MSGPPPYLSLDSLLSAITGNNGQAIRQLLADHRERYAHARGSSRNHQAWPGGFWDHTTEVLNIAYAQYHWMNSARELPFELSDALLVLACHDLEKLVRFRPDGSEEPGLREKGAKAAYRLGLMAEYGIQLSPQQANALWLAEGVKDVDYSNQQRLMSPLACFVHTCDLLSARMWFNHPLPADEDSWTGSRRISPEASEVMLPGEELDSNGRPLPPELLSLK